MTWQPTRGWPEIRQLIVDMQNQQGPLLMRMREVLDRYDGDIVIPVPELSDEPKLPPLTPMLIADAVDSLGTRASGVRPSVFCPAVDQRKATGKGSLEFAQRRRRALSYVYEESKWQLGTRRFYRHLAAYHTGNIVVTPDFVKGLPHIGVRDPLATFIDPQSAESLNPPKYAAFITRYSGNDLRAMYPMARAENDGPITDRDVNHMWDVAEWIDDDQIRFGIVGPVMSDGYHVNNQTMWNTPSMPISEPYENKAGMCIVFSPCNVSLGKVASRMAAMIGNIDLQAKLVALDIAAQTRAIFPDMYVLSAEGAQARLATGPHWKPGSSGEINIVEDAKAVSLLHVQADPRTQQSIDRLERNFRVSSQLVPQTGGETYGALRTGAGINALAGMAIDPMLQEMHEIYESWMRHANEAILATWKGYWPDRKYTVFSGWAGDKGELDITPSVHIETFHNTVNYAIPGADITQTTQILGSLAGAQAISVETFRTLHPYVEDPQLEGERLNGEELERALRQALANQLVQGQLPLEVATMVHDELLQGVGLFKAVMTANSKLKAQQAAAPPPTPDGMMAHPDQMPGMAAGPGAAMAPAAPPAGPNEQGVSVPPDAVAMNRLMRVMAGKR